jgi:hypothetical protein
MSSSKRWVEILRVIRDDLPGRWTIRGRGMKTTLIREPIGWTIPWIGASKGSFGRLHAGVAPAVEQAVSWRTGPYGLDMVDVRGGPRGIDFGATDDLDVARTFVGHALVRIDELSPTALAEKGERGLQVMFDLVSPRSDMDLPSRYVMGAVGWRIVNDSGNPVEAAEQCIRYVEFQTWERATKDESIGFYRELIDVWTSGGRDESLTWLAERRDRQLAELGYGDDAIVD